MTATQTAPAGCPPCHAPAELRGAIWRRALKINRRARPHGTRGAQPFTGTTLRVLDYLLWHAPRWRGALYPSAETIARAITAGERSVHRAIKTLSDWGLLMVHARYRRQPKPIRVGDRGFVVPVGCRTSNAYTFPSSAEWPCQTGGEGNLKVYENRDEETGRWLPAPVRDWVRQARAHLSQTVEPKMPETLTSRTTAFAKRWQEGQEEKRARGWRAV